MLLFPHHDCRESIISYEAYLAENLLAERSLWWKLGIAYILNNELEKAQAVWFSVFEDALIEDLTEWSHELIELILEQIQFCQSKNEESLAGRLYSQASEILPDNLEFSIHALNFSINQGEIEAIDLTLERATENLIESHGDQSQSQLIFQTIKTALNEIPICPFLGKFIQASLPCLDDLSSLLITLQAESFRIAYSLRCSEVAAELVEICLLINPDDLELLGHLSSFYQNARQFDLGIQAAQRRLEMTNDLPDKIFSTHLIIRGFLSAGGYWNEASAMVLKHYDLLSQISLESLQNAPSAHILRLFTAPYYLPYFEDGIQNRKIQNHISQVCQVAICQSSQEFRHSKVTQKIQPFSNRKLKIGYLSYCMSQHSVGWLARWLIQHHDRQKFELYGYFINEKPHDSLYQWYVSQFDQSCCLSKDFSNETKLLYKRIQDDEIDILIDLDSITLDVSCEILAMKPAPIQVTWLGWDAIGMSAIDYFIADPYVLPENAQDYYVEKIWRLPDTYLAVDGFEVAVPTLTREDLEIPTEAVIFLTAQRGYKRHRDTAVLQMQIIAGTPNSYLCIKGFADDQAIQNFFYEIADEVGVDRDRLRFLESDPSEAVHRANLRIADVVLDTYPYNGATTTMETLWMEVPIVTRVGEQFAARNSYTMMINAGITEGIAWSAEEYVEWGIKLGKNTDLRQEVSWKLRHSKKTSPLWNGKKFTRNMEDAYRQMIAIYTESKK
jgi:predicted O-linked N-acetylglucosamine transferase (SPINDLY family)